jgi:hypothetical protein
MSEVKTFSFQLTAETRPFHIFQAFIQFRKAKFHYWNLHKWGMEIGLENKSILSEVLQGRALPDAELAEKMITTMQLEPHLKVALLHLIEAARVKTANRRARAS